MKKLVSLITLYWMALCLTACGQTRTISGNSVEISNSDSSNIVSYDAQNTEDAAKLNPITYYAHESDFPITVNISTSDTNTKKYSFDSYGKKLVNKVSFSLSHHDSYAYISIEPYPEETETPTVTNDNMGNTADIVDSDMEHTVSADDVEAEIDTAKVAIEDFSSADTDESSAITITDNNLINETKATKSKNTASSDGLTKEQLLGLLEEPTTESLRDPESIYRQEIDQLSSGTWDGSMRTDYIEHDDTTYEICHDAAVGRTYFWKKYNPDTGEESSTIIQIDYDGPLEVEGGMVAFNEYYSLVIDRDHNIIEQWSLFEKQDSWQLKLTGNNERIDYTMVYLDEERRGIVVTVDENDRQHTYNLLTGGIITKIN